MKEIILTSGHIAQVDDADYEFLNRFKWNGYVQKNTVYVGRGCNINGKYTT